VKVSSRIKTLRAYVDAQPRQKTQGEIARELGLSESQLSLYLTGARTPSRDTALRLAREFGFDLEALLDPEVRA
jgi:transcriptional regulator with XRE-family HTH domain